MGFYRWKPSKKSIKEFKETMDQVENFCKEKKISFSSNMDSFYFEIRGQKYRVSNHSVEASNKGAYDWMGNKLRNEYHANGREDDTVYIHASKTRLIEIYNNLEAGKKLDGRGYIKEV